MGALRHWLLGDARADQVVPPSGFTARLTVVTAAIMAFLAAFALALGLAALDVAAAWRAALADSVTVRVIAPPERMAPELARVLEVLGQTPGVRAAREIPPPEQAKLLEPWLGPDLPLDDLPLPGLVAVTTGPGFDAEALRLRLRAEAPDAVLDDHARWRGPLVASARALGSVALLAVGLILVALAAMVTLAALAALAANRQVITVLRTLGAEDRFIARAFVRRFTLRTLAGAALGALAALAALWLLPGAGAAAGLPRGLAPVGGEILLYVLIPVLAAAVALIATRLAAGATLRRLT
ncbi:MAG: cell division protein FtsX [Alphaproteobacteria bacterium]|nr:MAG: cell division protein FtsX [Alphaproteobacteria bacterium]